MTPYPKKPLKNHNWWDHQTRKFIHQKIFNSPSDINFILSLDPNLVYYVSQLWAEIDLENPNSEQWLYFLEEICKWYENKGAMIKQVHTMWKELINSYKEM
jgi:hypothetical protein